MYHYLTKYLTESDQDIEHFDKAVKSQDTELKRVLVKLEG